MILITTLYVFFIILPSARWALTFLENRYPRLEIIPSDATGIILLGGSFDLNVTHARKVIAYNKAASRIIAFAELARKNPTRRLVFSGRGRKAEAYLGESYLTKEVLTNLGINTKEIIFEDQSRNTFENAIFSSRLLEPKSGEKWVLVTSAFHMPRAVSLFHHAGFNIIPYPVDYHTTGLYNFHTSNLQDSCSAWAIVVSEFLSLTRNYFRGVSKIWIPGSS